MIAAFIAWTIIPMVAVIALRFVILSARYHGICAEIIAHDVATMPYQIRRRARDAANDNGDDHA